MAISAPLPTAKRASSKTGRWLNDCHSQLNRTWAAHVVCPEELEELVRAVSEAEKAGLPIALSGGRHAMGGQQFCHGALQIDMSGLDGVIAHDWERGLIEVEAGMRWPALLAYLDETRSEHGLAAGPHGWAIAQKQTGADELSLGGALSANIHGRGLSKGPFVEDIESFTLLDAHGTLRRCTRRENEELFSLAIGGYGLFGIICTVRLRLVPRQRLQRTVSMVASRDLMPHFEERIASGCVYGDYQFQIDDQVEGFLREGIVSCYAPAGDEVSPQQGAPPALNEEDWLRLLHLAHTDKSKAFASYRRHYERTDGGHYWSDAHQFTTYVKDYHREIESRGKLCRGSEMITELYVPRGEIATLLTGMRDLLRKRGASVIYGTVRLIEQEDSTCLAWAREPWACVAINLCVDHTAPGRARARVVFRELIDEALTLGGSYYLTYHGFARADQMKQGHPNIQRFLKMKQRYDPQGRFQSRWWRYCAQLLQD